MWWRWAWELRATASAPVWRFKLLSQHRLPVIHILFINAHGMCVNDEQLFYNDFYNFNRFSPSRLPVTGLSAKSSTEFDEQLTKTSSCTDRMGSTERLGPAEGRGQPANWPQSCHRHLRVHRCERSRARPGYRREQYGCPQAIVPRLRPSHCGGEPRHAAPPVGGARAGCYERRGAHRFTSDVDDAVDRLARFAAAEVCSAALAASVGGERGRQEKIVVSVPNHCVDRMVELTSRWSSQLARSTRNWSGVRAARRAVVLSADTCGAATTALVSPNRHRSMHCGCGGHPQFGSNAGFRISDSGRAGKRVALAT